MALSNNQLNNSNIQPAPGSSFLGNFENLPTGPPSIPSPSSTITSLPESPIQEVLPSHTAFSHTQAINPSKYNDHQIASTQNHLPVVPAPPRSPPPPSEADLPFKEPDDPGASSPFSVKKLMLQKVLPIVVIIFLISAAGYYLDPLGIFDQDPESLSTADAKTPYLEGEILEISKDTNIKGKLTINGEFVAPNVIFALRAGDNISITGGQNPVISAAFTEIDTLASITARENSTTQRLSLLGGADFGSIIGMASLSSDPSGASNGSIYYNNSSNRFRCYINGSWTDCDTDTDTVGSDGDITAVTVGDGLSGGGSSGDISLDIVLPTTGSSSNTSSNSGIELSVDGISLLRGCSNGEVLKWNGSLWACASDAGGAGSSTVEEGGVVVSAAIDTYNYESSDFNVSTAGSTATIAIDYSNSNITRTNQTQSISGAWTFSDLTVSDTNIALSGASTTLTATGAFTLTPGGAVILGDGGDTLSINSSDWDISTTGAITNATYEGLTISTTTGTLTLGNSKTFQVDNTLTFTGTDSTSFAFPSSSGTVCTTSTCLTSSSGVSTLTGTANQVLVNGTSGAATSGAITLTLPQSIATTSTPTFSGMTISGLSNNSAVYTNGSAGLTTTAPSSGTIGYWSRSSTTLSPATANDILSISSNDIANPVVSITSTGATGNAFSLTGNSITGGTLAAITGVGFTTGEILDITGTFSPFSGTNEAIDLNITHSSTGAATFSGIDLAVSDATAFGNNVRGFTNTLTLTGDAGKAGYGIHSTVTTSSTTADNTTNVYLNNVVSGAISSGTRNVTGIESRVQMDVANTGGTTNIFGVTAINETSSSTTGSTVNSYSVYAGGSAFLDTGGTLNAYGLFAASISGSSTGTTAGYGLYVNAPSGFDTNVGAYIGGNVGIGDTTPAALLSVGNGDLFQINSTGQIGSQIAPTSDYLFSLDGSTSNDYSRIINITQANNALENSNVINIANTANTGALSGTGVTIRNINSSMTPTSTVDGFATLEVDGIYSGIAPSTTIGDGTNNAYITSGNFYSTYSPTFNSASNSDSVFNSGVWSRVSGSTTLTSVSLGSALQNFGLRSDVTFANAGDANLSVQNFGLYTTVAGDLTTTGFTEHIGGYFEVAGTADTNYALYLAAVSQATTNYTIYSSSTAQSYFAGNIGIGDDLSADVTFEIEQDVAEQFRLGYDNTNYASFAVSSGGDLTLSPSGGNFTLAGNLLPSTNDARDLGSDSLRWRDLYLGGETLHIGTSTTDEGTLSYNTTTNVFNFGTDSTTNGDIAFFTDDLYLDKSSGNVGIGDSSPASLLSVGSGDLFQVNSTGQIGSQQAPQSDYLFALTGSTSNDFSRIIDITQSNDADENSAALMIANTSNTGSIGGARSIRNLDLTLTPTSTVSNGRTLTNYGILNNLSLSNITMGTAGTGNALYGYADYSGVTGTPTINNSNANQSVNVAGIFAESGITPTLTAVGSSSILRSYAGYFLGGTTSAGNANLQVDSYAVYAIAGNDLTTTGTTSHYAGYFQTQGTADNNYGIYISGVTDATNNYALYSNASASSYFAGNVGIGTAATTPTQLLHVAQANAGAPVVARIENTSTAASNNSAYLYLIANGESNTGNVYTRYITQDGGASEKNWFTGIQTSTGIFGIYPELMNGKGINIEYSNGNVGIGTTTMGSTLQVNGGAAIGYNTSQAAPSNGLQVSGTVSVGTTSTIGKINTNGSMFFDFASENWCIRSNSSDTQFGIAESDCTNDANIIFRVNNDNTVAVVGSATTCILGNGTSATNCSSSDERLKTNIITLDGTEGLEAINKLKAVSYNFNDWMQAHGSPGNTQFGFIAQDIIKIFPNLVNMDQRTGYYTLDYVGLIAPTIKAVQELDQKIDNALLTIGDDGQAVTELKGEKLTISQDANIAGTVVASNYSFDATNLLRTGSLASLPVNSQGQTTIVDAINTLAQVQNSQSDSIASLQNDIQEAQVLGEQAVEHALTLDEKVASTSSTLSSLQSKIDELLSGFGSEPVSTDSSNTEENLTSPEVLTTSDSVEITNILVHSEATISGTIQAYNGIFQNSLKSLGETLLGNTTLAGDLHINGTMTIGEDNTINAIGILKLQTSPLAEKVEVFNGLITLEKDGSIIAKSIALEELKVLGGKTAGTAAIAAGSSAVIIENPLIKESSVISITPEVLIDIPLAVTEKISDTSFKVEIAGQALVDIPFTYLIVNQE